jgi:hypothetical protein
MKAKISVSYNAGKLASQMPKIVEKYMQRYGRSAEKGSKEAIDKGLKPPLAQFTIEHRKNKGQGGINKNVEELCEDTKYFVENEDKDPIAMPASVYEEICDVLESDYIPFMGIS